MKEYKLGESVVVDWMCRQKAEGGLLASCNSLTCSFARNLYQGRQGKLAARAFLFSDARFDSSKTGQSESPFPSTILTHPSRTSTPLAASASSCC